MISTAPQKFISASPTFTYFSINTKSKNWASVKHRRVSRAAFQLEDVGVWRGKSSIFQQKKLWGLG